MEWFGGDPNVLGRSYSIAGAMRTVVGVMGPDFDFPSEDVLLWFPSTLGRRGSARSRRASSACRSSRAFAAASDREALIAQLDADREPPAREVWRPGRLPDIIERFVPRVVPLEEELLGPLARPLWILLGAMAILLVIAGANVANFSWPAPSGNGATSPSGTPSARAAAHSIRRHCRDVASSRLLAGALAIGVARRSSPRSSSRPPGPSRCRG